MLSNTSKSFRAFQEQPIGSTPRLSTMAIRGCWKKKRKLMNNFNTEEDNWWSEGLLDFNNSTTSSIRSGKRGWENWVFPSTRIKYDSKSDINSIHPSWSVQSSPLWSSWWWSRQTHNSRQLHPQSKFHRTHSPREVQFYQLCPALSQQF